MKARDNNQLVYINLVKDVCHDELKSNCIVRESNILLWIGLI